MRKLLPVLLSALAMVCLVVPAGPAGADDVSLACMVTPSSPYPAAFSNPCMAGNGVSPQPTQFVVTFQVQNPVQPYGYTWSVPSPWSGRITSGCTDTSIDCTFTADIAQADITVSATWRISRTFTTVTATAQLCPMIGRVSSCS